MSCWSRMVNVFRVKRLAREIDEEMESHIAEAIEQGRDPNEARKAFGSKVRRREDSMDARMIGWLDSLRSDVTFGCRQLRKNKTASAAAIVSLALAVGACIAAFRLIDAMLLRPLPVKEPTRLFVLTYPYRNVEGKTETGDSFAYPQFRTLRTAVEDQADLIAISAPSRHGLTFGSDDETEKFWQQSVSGWMFDSFGLKPAVGRLLTAGDDVKPGASPVAVLSYDYWTRRFGRDPRAVGRKFRMGTDTYEIVGVCQEGFTGTDPGMVTDVFVPTMMNAQAIDKPGWNWFRTWVRLKPGIEPEPVRERLRAAVAAYRRERVKSWGVEMSRERIEEYTRAVVSLEPASSGVSGMQREYRRALVVLAAVVALVLLIACANVANLMTAQAAARAREMALRVAIGAGRRRLVQLVMVESVLLASSASVLGGLFAWWSAPFVMSRINVADNPARLMLPADWRVLGFAAGLASAVTVLFGVIPALRASAVKPMSTLRGGEDRHSARLMHALVAAQVAFCFVVCFAGGLFVATFERLARQPLGFVPERLVTLETVTRNNQPSVYWDQVRQHLQEVHGVESAALCGWALMTGNGWSESIWLNGTLRDDEAYFLAVSPGWLQTMRIPLIGGRDFHAQDEFPKVAIVNEAFARRYFDGRDPVGQIFEQPDGDERVRTEIVGYVRDARYRNMRESIRPTIYIPFNTDTPGGGGWATFVVRTVGPDPLSLASVLRREVPRARQEFRVVNVRTQTELVEQHTVRERLLAMLALFFAAVALVLAGVGLYGVLTYSVLRCRREIGIRIALGAPSGAVARRIATEILAMLAAGAAIGLLAGLASQRYLENLLYQVKGNDPVMLGLPALTIVAAALISALPPVLDAVRTDPAETLRAE